MGRFVGEVETAFEAEVRALGIVQTAAAGSQETLEFRLRRGSLFS
jgi:hypothetical protein